MRNDDDGLFDGGGPDHIMGSAFGNPKRTEKKRAARGGHPDDDRHIGCPVWWLRLVFPVVKTKSELVVAVYLFRLRVVHRSKTVSVSNEWLRDIFGIDRAVKCRVLKRLVRAKLIRTKQRGHKAVEVMFVR